MKKILYYVTDHGKGHATRSIAIIQEILKRNVEVIIRNTNAIEFFKQTLPDVKTISGKTDVGSTIKKDGFSIDKNETMRNQVNWIHDFEKNLLGEKQIVNKINPDLIVSDISAIPFLVSKQVSVPSIAISNFSWFDVLNFLPPTELTELRTAYDAADLAIQLPLGTPMNHFDNKIKVGLVSRTSNLSKQQFNKIFQMDGYKYSVVFALSGSNFRISYKKSKNVKVFTMNTKVEESLEHEDYTNLINGHDLVSNSDLVICKCGYGIISECLTSGIPFYYIVDDEHIEQKSISQDLERMGLTNRITLSDINDIILSQDKLESLKSLHEPNDVNNVVNKLVEFIKN
jgi:uncharacterized protein (TIGR00661 family)